MDRARSITEVDGQRFGHTDEEGAKTIALIDDVDSLQSIYINRATGNGNGNGNGSRSGSRSGNDDDERDYPLYRQSVLDDPRVASMVPTWGHRYRNLEQFFG